VIDASGEVWALPELHRLRGALSLKQQESDPSEAEACFRRAMEIANGMDARLYELRAAAGLAGLLRDRGRADEARDTLAPVYQWFTEGFDQPDLRDARAVLEAPS